MKKILFLLLFTITSYGQAVFDEGIQITNTESTTATKVNVQEANGKVNTKTINTAFNKNFGLNTGDVVGAATLLNQYSATPIAWTATAFSSGHVVFYAGKQWLAKMATVAGDVPAVSSKWEEITFEALSNKTVIVDDIPTDGSNNAVSSNAVFDALATKAPISSVHNPVTIGTANGLSLSTQQLSLGLASSGVTGALSGTDWTTFNGKFNTPTGLTTNYLPKWNGSGFENSTIFYNGTTTNIRAIYDTSIDLDYQHYVSGGITITGKHGVTKNTAIALGNRSLNTGGIDFLTSNGGGLLVRMTIAETGNALIGTTTDNGVDKVQVNGTITASPAVLHNQVPILSQVVTLTGIQTIAGPKTFSSPVIIPNGVIPNEAVNKGQLDAVGRPYKVYTAMLSQAGTDAPTATVLENTLGGTVVWSRTATGEYDATLSNAFTTNKTVCFITIGANTANNIVSFKSYQSTSRVVKLQTYKSTSAAGVGAGADSALLNATFEIRVYN